jgi:Conjugal transfer protein
MRFATVLLASAASAAMSCAALADTPSHIRRVSCSPYARTEIIGILGHPTIVTFPPGEQFYRAPMTAKMTPDGVPEQGAWNGVSPTEGKDVPLGNNVPLWPATTDRATITIITVTGDTDHMVQHAYPFLLSAVANTPAALDDARVTLNLYCTRNGAVPTADDAAAPRPPVRQAQYSPAQIQAWSARQKAQRDAADQHLRTDSFNGADGVCHYHAQGRRPNEIQPRCPMDNGIWTLIRFPGLTKKPAAYIGTCVKGDDDERLARQHADGDFVVVEEIAANICLRLGDAVLRIINDAYDPAGRPTGTGTTSPTVTRDLIQASGK